MRRRGSSPPSSRGPGRPARVAAALALLITALAGCTALPDAFTCTSSAQCALGDTPGVCELDGRCSAADPGCASGRRYVAAGERADTCVAADGAPGGPSLCAALGGVLCEGFEDATVGSAWDVFVPNAAYERTSGRAARGAASGHFALAAAGATGRTYGELGAPTVPATGTVAARAFFFLPTAPPYAASRLLAVRQTEGAFRHIQLGFAGGTLALHSSITGTNRVSAVALPTGRWFCLELEVTYGQPGTVRSYLDGAELTALRLDETTAASPPTSGFYLGLAIDDPGTPAPAYEYWVDEVAFDTTRVGCAR